MKHGGQFYALTELKGLQAELAASPFTLGRDRIESGLAGTARYGADVVDEYVRRHNVNVRLVVADADHRQRSGIPSF